MFIGRFQPFHKGHEWCVREMLSNGKKVCIAVMDIHEDEPEDNPYTYKEVWNKILRVFIEEINVGDVEIMKIPPIESINYGRDTGYKIIEHKPPEEIRKIKGRELRSDIII